MFKRKVSVHAMDVVMPAKIPDVVMPAQAPISLPLFQKGVRGISRATSNLSPQSIEFSKRVSRLARMDASLRWHDRCVGLQRKVFFAFFLCASFVMSFSLLASTEVHEAAAGINWWGLGLKYSDNPALGWYIITFLVFTGGVIYAVKKPLGIYLEARSAQIRDGIETAQKERAEAAARIKLYEGRLKSLDKEIAELKAGFEKRGQEEKENLVREAKILSEQIAKASKESIRAEGLRARASLKEEMAGLAIMLAKEKMADGRAHIDMQTLQDDLIQDLARGQ